MGLCLQCWNLTRLIHFKSACRGLLRWLSLGWGRGSVNRHRWAHGHTRSQGVLPADQSSQQVSQSLSFHQGTHSSEWNVSTPLTNAGTNFPAFCCSGWEPAGQNVKKSPSPQISSSHPVGWTLLGGQISDYFYIMIQNSNKIIVIK